MILRFFRQLLTLLIDQFQVQRSISFDESLTINVTRYQSVEMKTEEFYSIDAQLQLQIHILYFLNLNSDPEHS